MQHQLIIESGSSKVEWSWINESTYTASFSTGIHPFFLNSWQIAEILREQIAGYDERIRQVDEIYYYGTGIRSASQVALLEESLHLVFPKAILHVEDDMLAAARSLCRKSPGIACILGTGSNACFYDGNEMKYKRSGYGYIIGDEGGGSFLGKIIIRRFLYKEFSEVLLAKFQQQFSVSAESILDNVYRNPFASQFLASFTQFLSMNRGEPEIEEILRYGLDDFFNTRLLYFPEKHQYPVHFTGSIAFYFQDVLRTLALKHKMEIGNITRSPMKGLLEYHSHTKNPD